MRVRKLGRGDRGVMRAEGGWVEGYVRVYGCWVTGRRLD